MTVPTDQERLRQLRGHLDELLEKFDFVYRQIEFAIQKDDEAIAIQGAEDLF